MRRRCRYQSSVTPNSSSFKWVMELNRKKIFRFMFKLLPEDLKKKSMLHQAAAAGLLKYISIDNNGVKEWELDFYEIAKIK